jgi:hypothetical protein
MSSEDERYRGLQELGCIACLKRGNWSAPDIHHLNLGGHAGGKRRGWRFTIPLCPPHHRGVMWREELYGPSLALHPRRFREVFGSDDELLAEVNSLLGIPPIP